MLFRGATDEGALLSSFTQTHDKKSTANEMSRFTNDGKLIVKHFASDVYSSALESGYIHFTPMKALHSNVFVKTLRIIVHLLLLFCVFSSEDIRTMSIDASSYVIESTHPYKCTTSTTTPFNVSGAVSYSLQFDALSSIVADYSNYVRICADKNCQNFFGSHHYSGIAGSGMWEPDYSLIVNATHFYIQFVIYNCQLPTDYGFKLYVEPLFEEIVPKLLIYDSPHDYWGYSNGIYTHVAVGGAIGYVARWDSRCSMEADATNGIMKTVWLFGPDKSTGINSGAYSGYQGIGGWNPDSNFTIYTPSFYIWESQNVATNNQVAWGYKLILYPIYSLPWPAVNETIIIDSPHPYGAVSYRTSISVPGAVAYTVEFDEKCAVDAIVTNDFPDYMNMFSQETGSSSQNVWGSFYYVGPQGNDIWTLGHKVMVYDSSFYFQFYTYNNYNHSYGFRAYVTPLFKTPEPSVQIIDSIHPYWQIDKSRFGMYVDVSVPGAAGYNVVFDPRSSTVSRGGYAIDYVSLMLDYGLYEIYGVGSGSYAGSNTSGVWNTDYNLTVYGSELVVTFYTSGYDTDWGFRAYIYPLTAEELAQQDITKTLIVDSPRPYSKIAYRNFYEIPGAIAYKIVFDSNCSIISTFGDYLKLLDSGGIAYGSPYYSGTAETDDFNPGVPLYINASSFFLYFTIASTNSDYGYRIYITPLFEKPPIVPIIIDSPHPTYIATYTYTEWSVTIDIPNVIGYYLRFDERSSLIAEGGMHQLNLYTGSEYSPHFLGNGVYSGNKSTGIWHSDTNLTINYGSFHLDFYYSYAEGRDWGFKVYIYPIVVGETIKYPESFVIDSPRPYINGYTLPVSVPNAVAYSLIFDGNSSIISECVQFGCDFLSVYTQTSQYTSDYWGTNYFTGLPGAGSWPNHRHPMMVYASYFSLFFSIHSEQVNYTLMYGFRVAVTPIYETPVPINYLISESPHDYFINTFYDTYTVSDTIEVPGAVGYEIQFDPRCNITATCLKSPCAYLSFCVDSTCQQWFGSPYISGDPDSGAWNPTKNLTIEASSFELVFFPGSEGRAWGYKVLIFPLTDLSTIPMPKEIEYDSPHNYWKMSYTNIISVTGATNYIVTFDPRTEIAVSDGLVFYKNGLMNSYWGEGVYSGSASNSQRKLVSGFKSFNITANTFRLNFNAYTNNSWGYKVTAEVSSASIPFACNDPDTTKLNETCACNAGYSFTTSNGASLIHRYSFNDGTATDSMGNKDGTVSAGTYFENNYVAFFGYESMTLPDNILPQNGTDLTLEMWVSFGSTKNQKIATFLNGSSSYYYLTILEVYCNGYNISVSYSSCRYCADTFYLTDNSTIPMCRNQDSVHIVFTVSETSYVESGYTYYKSDVVLYVNGTPAASDHLEYTSLYLPSLREAYGTLKPDSGQLLVDEFRIWQGALTSDQVKKSKELGPNSIICSVCGAGYYKPSVGSEACSKCPSNTYMPDTGSDSCFACPADSTSVEGSAVCLCDVGFYMDQVTNLCIICRPGETTNSIGAISSSECINIASSFAFGLFLLPVCLFIFVIYIYTGRIHIVAFIRKQYSIRFVSAVCINISTLVNTMSIEKRERKRKFRKSRNLWAIVKSWVYMIALVVGCLCVLMLGTVLFFIASVARAIFSAIIILRALQNSKFITAPKKVLDSIGDWLTSIEHMFQFLTIVFRPMIWVGDQIGNLKVDFSALGITCEGSQAPIKLFLNLFILFAVVIIIEADYHILMSSSLSEGCKSYCLWAFKSKSVSRCVSFLVSLLVAVLMQVQPIVSILQYLMTIVSIGDFVSDHGRHPSTSACDNANSMQNLDTWIAVLTTMVAFIILTPAISIVARIMYPGLPPTKNRDNEKSSYGYKVYYAYYHKVKSPSRYYNIVKNSGGSEKNDDAFLLSSKKSYKELFAGLIGSFDLWFLRWNVIFLRYLFHQITTTMPTNSIDNKVLTSVQANYDQESADGFAPIANVEPDPEDLSESLNNNDNNIDDDTLNVIVEQSNYTNDSNKQIYANKDGHTVTEEMPVADVVPISSASQEPQAYELPSTRELIDLILIEWSIDWIWYIFKIPIKLFLFIPINQLIFSSVGRFFWWIVLWKFYSFIVASLGFWTNTNRDYHFLPRLKSFIAPYNIRPCFIDGVAAIITPRAVLFQIIPEMTLLTIFTLHVANSPLLGFPNVSEFAIVYFNLNPTLEAWSVSNINEEKWVKYLNTFSHIFTLWRPFKLSYNVFMYSVVLALVLFDNSFWNNEQSVYVRTITMIVVFHSLCQSISFVVAYGKACDIRDSDLVCKVDTTYSEGSNKLDNTVEDRLLN